MFWSWNGAGSKATTLIKFATAFFPNQFYPILKLFIQKFDDDDGNENGHLLDIPLDVSAS